MPAGSEIEKVIRLGIDHANGVVVEFDVDDSSRELAFLHYVANDKFALIKRKRVFVHVATIASGSPTSRAVHHQWIYKRGFGWFFPVP